MLNLQERWVYRRQTGHIGIKRKNCDFEISAEGWQYTFVIEKEFFRNLITLLLKIRTASSQSTSGTGRPL